MAPTVQSVGTLKPGRTKEKQRALQALKQTAADHSFWGPHWGLGLSDAVGTRGYTAATKFWGGRSQDWFPRPQCCSAGSRFPRESKRPEKMLEEGGHRTVGPGTNTEINLEAVKTGNGC